MIKKIFILFLVLICNLSFANHNKGGRIEVHQIGPFTFEITITTYTRTSSIQADRPTLDSVYMGDGSPSIVFVRLSKIDMPGDISVNTYMHYYTYPTSGFFLIHFEDPNRDANIINIPNSVNVPFYLETEIKVDPYSCPYSSAHLLSIPIFETPIGKDFILSRAAYDENWDSLSFELDTCLGAGGLPIPGYSIPSGISLNSANGELKWIGNSMITPGIYAFAIHTTKWRDGIYSGFVEEDFQFEIISATDSNYNFNTSSYPLNFSSSLLPGNLFNLHVEYYDSTSTPAVVFYSEFLNSSMFTSTVNNHLVSGDFTWIPASLDIRTTPYILQFRGKKDLTYLLYVDGIRTDTACRPLVGIDEISNENDNITIFPNPCIDKIQIKVNGFNSEKIKASIFDMEGKIVLEKYLSPDKIINVSFLSSGMYILKIENNKKVFYNKFLIY